MIRQLSSIQSLVQLRVVVFEVAHAMGRLVHFLVPFFGPFFLFGFPLWWGRFFRLTDTFRPLHAEIHRLAPYPIQRSNPVTSRILSEMSEHRFNKGWAAVWIWEARFCRTNEGLGRRGERGVPAKCEMSGRPNWSRSSGKGEN